MADGVTDIREASLEAQLKASIEILQAKRARAEQEGRANAVGLPVGSDPDLLDDVVLLREFERAVRSDMVDGSRDILLARRNLYRYEILRRMAAGWDKP